MTDSPTNEELLRAQAERLANQLLTTDANLPSIHLDEFAPVTRKSTEEEIIDADVAIVNAMLKIAHKGWGGVRTLAGVGHMVTTTLKLIEGRRKVLGKPYGYIDKNERSIPLEVPE